MIVSLPFPPSSLAGHNNGHWRNRDREVATIRAEAFHITRKAMRDFGYKPEPKGDIPILIQFTPENDRGDRVNYPIRVKAQLDGIAEALGVNDKRFLPFYAITPPMKPGWVEVEFLPLSTVQKWASALENLRDSARNIAAPESAANAQRGLTQTLVRSVQDAA